MKLIKCFRLDPNYMYYYIHWTRLLTTGIIPFTYLVIINMKIYCRMRQNNLSTVRSRSLSMKKAGNLAAILIVIGTYIHIIYINSLPVWCVLMSSFLCVIFTHWAGIELIFKKPSNRAFIIVLNVDSKKLWIKTSSGKTNYNLLSITHKTSVLQLFTIKKLIFLELFYLFCINK